MNASQIAALSKRLAAASHAYHNGLELLMTDEEFDADLDALRAAAPTHPFLSKVGAPVAAGDEVALPIPLPSLNKIKPDGAFRAPSEAGGQVSAGTSSTLEKWMGRYKVANYHISAKLDGCSALWFPASGQLFTRGDGMRGRDISAFVPYFQGLAKPAAPCACSGLRGELSKPVTPAQLFAVRGELIMRTDSVAIPAGKLARNIVAGALNRKDVDTTLFAEIRFVAYELIQPNTLTPEAAYKLLRTNGFEVAHSRMVAATDMTPVSLSEIFSNAEAKSPYQMDGIVVAPSIARPSSWTPEVRKGASVNPDDRVAWKTRLTASSARTTVRVVEWNVSASGMLIPRVLFDTVTLAGANISAATGLHGRWIYENAVGPGAEIEVRRAGDVIPQIIAVHTPSPAGAAMPAAGFVWDGPTESAVHIRPAAGTMDTEAVCIQLTRGLSELGAENVGPGIVSKLHAAGFTSIGAIYAATAADFVARVPSCGAKGAGRIYEGLRVKQATWTEITLLLASCTMPRGVAASKLHPLLALEANPAAWPAALPAAACPPGLSTTTIEAIVSAIPAYIAWRTANPNIQPQAALVAPPSTPSAIQMVVVLTGFRDRALEATLQAAGHIITDSVTKRTTHVVYPDGPAPTTGKAAKAADVGARLLSVSEFRTLLDQ
jgi:NAD-dependent DNA ligase